MLLDVQNIHVIYGETEALKGISFSLQKGDTLIILGPNGSGKSTCLKALAGVAPVSDGRVIFDGRDITNHSARKRLLESIVFLPQGLDVFPSLSVRENFNLFVEELKSSGYRVSLDEVYSLFPEFIQKEESLAGNLSGGERRLLSLARAMIARPKLLLLDEPSSGLSPKMCERVYEKISTISKNGHSLILVEQLIDYTIAEIEKAYLQDRNNSNGTARVLLLNQGLTAMEFGVSAYKENRDKLASVFL